MNAFDICLSVLAEKGSVFLAHSYGMDAAAGDICKALKGLGAPDFDGYAKLREAFLTDKPANVSDAAAQKQWERLYKSTGHTIPKSTSADATARAVAREKEKADLAKLPEVELDKKIKALQDANFKPTDSVVKKYTAEKKRREEAANKPLMDKIKLNREAAIKALRNADIKTLEAVMKLLKVSAV